MRAGRMMNFPSKIYMEWRRSAMLQLKAYKGQADKRATIIYMFYVKDNRRRDLDNMIASVNDVLVEAGLLKDDSWQWLAIGGAQAAYDKANPRVALWIKED